MKLLKNLKISAKISSGFACVFILLLLNAAVLIGFSISTNNRIVKQEHYTGLQNNVNELMHILNESRITAGIFYTTHSSTAYADLTKQIMYCDKRLEKLHAYINSYPELSEFNEQTDEFSAMYQTWRNQLNAIPQNYLLEEEFTQEQEERFTVLTTELWRVNLLAHEILSHTAVDITDAVSKITQRTREAGMTASLFAIMITISALIAATGITFFLIRSITVPIRHMHDILLQIGKYGNLQIRDEVMEQLQTVSDGKDETAQSMAVLLHMVKGLQEIDESLFHVADRDLTVLPPLRSQQDTIGLAVAKMLENLNHEFEIISDSAEKVDESACNLSEDSNLLASGSKAQSESVERLSEAIAHITQKVDESAGFSGKAAELTMNIKERAREGTEKMNQMIQAITDINTAGQNIQKVIKVIDDIAFQTNILALNAAVEAAHAGSSGKGFAVVADEVRKLAEKSAVAANETSVLIEETTQKAALGASIAAETSTAFQEIVTGVENSSTMIGDISALSMEQSHEMAHVLNDVRHVEHIVEQNNKISIRSAHAATDITSLSGMLRECVSRFKVVKNFDRHLTGKDGEYHEI